ncbi:transcription factor Ouib-like [Drosophila obscura]|uniref:transcription factor Ouib-like n=1 Tax=Drosophila obscura TaxID=7282 RepID=UPI001BB17D67|nr:transcription factor Ouib-like [Drosophila obscura]
MNNQCRSCGSAIYNTKGRNLFQRQNAELLSNIDLVTGVSLKQDRQLPSCICASCAEYVNRAVAFRARFIQNQENFLARRREARDPQYDSDDKTSDAEQTAQDDDSLIAALDEQLKGRTDFDEPDAHETAQVADLLITSLQKDLGYGNKSSDTENIDESPAHHPTPKRLSKKSTTKSKSNRSTPLTSINVDQLANSNPLPFAKKKPFECEFCGKDFKNPSKLTRHLPAHTGERAFKCQHCDRSFTTRGNKIRHERTHTREGAFPCATCGMSFSHAFVLKKHNNKNHTETSA